MRISDSDIERVKEASEIAEVVSNYFPLKKKTDLPDAKLQTVEKIIFGHAREGDISGNMIPKVYRDYVYGAEDGEKMAKLIHHNMLDTASTIGVLVYLGS